MNTYIHIIEGRMRIKIPEVKRDPAHSALVVRSIQQLQGVTQVHANPTTGSVLVLFDSTMIRPDHIIQALRQHGYLTRPEGTSLQSAASPSVSRRLVETLVNAAFEKAVWHLIVALM